MTYLTDEIIPNIFFLFTAVVFKEQIIKLADLKTAANSLIECQMGGKLLSHLLKYLAYEYGPHYVRDLWSESKCQWKDFIGSDDSKEFIKNNVSK